MKIGVSMNMGDRMTSLLTAMPCDMRIIGTVPGGIREELAATTGCAVCGQQEPALARGEAAHPKCRQKARDAATGRQRAARVSASEEREEDWDKPRWRGQTSLSL